MIAATCRLSASTCLILIPGLYSTMKSNLESLRLHRINWKLVSATDRRYDRAAWSVLTKNSFPYRKQGKYFVAHTSASSSASEAVKAGLALFICLLA